MSIHRCTLHILQIKCILDLRSGYLHRESRCKSFVIDFLKVPNNIQPLSGRIFHCRFLLGRTCLELGSLLVFEAGQKFCFCKRLFHIIPPQHIKQKNYAIMKFRKKFKKVGLCLPVASYACKSQCTLSCTSLLVQKSRKLNSFLQFI